jgi:hypothetical protein
MQWNHLVYMNTFCCSAFWQNLNCEWTPSICNHVCCVLHVWLLSSINDHEPNPWHTKFCGKIVLEDTKTSAMDFIYKRIYTSSCNYNLVSWNLHDTSIMNIPRAYLSVVWMHFTHYWHGSPFPSCRTWFRQSFNNAWFFLLVMNTCSCRQQYYSCRRHLVVIMCSQGF